MKTDQPLFGFLLALSLPFCALSQTAQPTLSQPIPSQSLNQGSAEIDLRNHFGLPGVTGQVVQFVTNLGRFNVELYSVEAPRHVANFLSYVSRTAYDNSIIHRIDNLGAVVPARVQGGAFQVGAFTPTPPAITPGPPVALEYRLPNTRGTLAAGRSPDAPNNAANEWFINTIDNTATLGPTNQGGYTVFGHVIGTGMTVVDAIAQVPTFDLAAAGLNKIPLRNFTNLMPPLTTNLIVVSSVRAVPIYPPDQGDPTAVLNFAATSSAPSVVGIQITGSKLKVIPLSPGTANVTVQARDVNGVTSAPTSFAVTVPPNALMTPIFTSQPVSQTIPAGSTIVLNASASGGNYFYATHYQWFQDGNVVRTADSPYLILRGINDGHAGTYHCVATNAMGSTPSTAATVTVLPPTTAEEGRFANLAALTRTGTRDDPLVIGFSVGGGDTGNLPLLMRAMGPSLAQFGVGNALSDPSMAVYRERTLIAANDDWNGDGQVAARTREVGAFAFASTDSLDAACAYSLPPAPYTIHVFGKAEETGLSLVELYDGTQNITRSSPRLVNISARTQVTAENDLAAGFVIRGTTPVTVLIRAVGPTLATLGIADALPDPTLQLSQGAFLVRANDNWDGDTQIEWVGNAVGAFRLSESGSKDAAMLVTLQPGSYTARVSSKVSGTVLVEVYEFR